MLISIKILFILFFIFFSVFLTYENYINSQNKYLQSSTNPLYNKTKDFIAITSGIAGLSVLFTGSSKEDMQVKLNEYKAKTAVLEQQIAAKAEQEQIIRDREEKLRAIEQNKLNIENSKIKEDLVKVTKEKEAYQKELSQLQESWEDHIKKVSAIHNNPALSDTEKESQIHEAAKNFKPSGGSSNFINLDFNLQEFLGSLTRLELFAFISLCFNSVIISALVSIVFILYGDFLIKYFDLELKYPKIAKFIHFRKKISKYALYYNIFIIFFSAVCQLIAGLIIF